MDTIFTSGTSFQGMLDFEFILGGIYVFDFDGELTVHRLLRLEGDSFIFKGDLSLSVEAVERKKIIARVKSPFETALLFLSRLYDNKRPRLIQLCGKFGLLLISKVIAKPL